MPGATKHSGGTRCSLAGPGPGPGRERRCQSDLRWPGPGPGRSAPSRRWRRAQAAPKRAFPVPPLWRLGGQGGTSLFLRVSAAATSRRRGHRGDRLRLAPVLVSQRKGSAVLAAGPSCRPVGAAGSGRAAAAAPGGTRSGEPAPAPPDRIAVAFKPSVTVEPRGTLVGITPERGTPSRVFPSLHPRTEQWDAPGGELRCVFPIPCSRQLNFQSGWKSSALGVHVGPCPLAWLVLAGETCLS